MKDLVFEALAPETTRELLTEITAEILPIKLPLDKTLVQVAALPFYPEHKFYALTDMTLPPPNVRYMLYKPGDVNLMNWTNEPIYTVNEHAPIKLKRTVVMRVMK